MGVVTGELRDEQKPALQEMLKHDNGILHAATAFGKTVVCSALIAERKVNTLIILESSALIEQWEESLGQFLNIDEELPKYKTKTGRIKTRKSLIGTLQGAHDSLTGIVDKEKAKAQGIDHLVYPRFTRTVPPRGVTTEKMHPNEAYEIIRYNDLRDEQIVSDVRECITDGRTPVILSRYKDHSEKLYERVKA